MMNNNLAIKVENLSKMYLIGAYDPYLQLRKYTIHNLQYAKAKFLKQPLPPQQLDFPEENILWALKDVSFEVEKGERIGIIGRNGAGKSTLLKILSRITKPTSGYAEIYGRLGALLEVGTGFHPELSGRENIYLNATILGLSKEEINNRFDEIVSFAEINRFIDTPMKHYSSGMYARLAFSVAAHLDPDILVIDEVLSVGDAAFQKKSLGKMEKAAKDGRTLILVSHSVATVMSFCTRCIWLDQGKLVDDGLTMDVTTHYQDSLSLKHYLPINSGPSNGNGEIGKATEVPVKGQISGLDVVNQQYSNFIPLEINDSTNLVLEDGDGLSAGPRYGNGMGRFTSMSLLPLDENGNPQPVLRVGYDLKIDLVIHANEDFEDANPSLIIYDLNGYRLVDVNTAINGEYLDMQAGQEAKISFYLKNVLLKPSLYQMGLWLGRRNRDNLDGMTYVTQIIVEDNPKRIKHFQVFPGPYQCDFSHSMNISALEQPVTKTD